MFTQNVIIKSIFFSSEQSLSLHVVKFHSQLNLNKYPSSSFYNIVTSLNDFPQTLMTNNDLNQSNLANLHSIKTLIQNLPKEYYIYLCLNCRLFFTSNSTFSHNCWNMKENQNDPKQISSKPGLNNGKNNSNNDPNKCNNYFSPIYLKFNVSKLLVSANKPNQ